jgi:hypothetical protein
MVLIPDGDRGIIIAWFGLERLCDRKDPNLDKSFCLCPIMDSHQSTMYGRVEIL